MTDRTLQISPTQQLRVLRSDSDVFEVESTYSGGGQRPPTHLHPHHDERFLVLEGHLRAEVDGQVIDLNEGDGLTIRRGQTHTFWNASDDPARVHWISEPAMRCDSWFTGLARLTVDAQTHERPVDLMGLERLRQDHADTFVLAGTSG